MIARLLGLDRELASVAAREHPDQALSPTGFYRNAEGL